MKFDAKVLTVMAATSVAITLMELILRLFTFGFSADGYLPLELLVAALAAVVVAGLLVMLKELVPGKWGNILFSAISIVISVAYAAQVVYYSIFGTFYTTYSMFNGAQVAEFVDVIFGTIWKEKIPILLLIGTACLLVYLVISIEKKKEGQTGRNLGYTVVIAAVSFAMIWGITSIKDENPESPYQRMHSVNEIQENAKSFGIATASAVDTWRLVFGFEPELEEDAGDIIQTMDNHFADIEPSGENDKTGIFEGKNLIFITAESFTDFAIHPVYTPTLYKLQTEGYTFANYYNPIWGVSTSDGEYVNLQGLIPKPGVWSMKESSDNQLPFTLGNQFSKLGYETKAYHNHSAYYYDRHLSHPNLGYDYMGEDLGHDFENTWPESDLEMIDETTADYLTPDEKGEIKPFHVYYLTVSGHLNYNFYANDMAIKHEEEVADLDMSDPCRAYMACNIELDKALELLLQRLEEAGELENTVIAIAGDHYPYGLDPEQISEFKGHTVDTAYEMYESAFILWTSGMEPERVDKVSSNMDILPTLSNMFGLEYDSRLMMGKDIFSDSEGLVVFKDKNWITSRGTRESLVGAEDDYVAAMDKKVSEMFAYSMLILDKDYYSYPDVG